MSTARSRDTFVVPAALDGARTDRALAELLDVGVNAARRLIDAGRVGVDGKRSKKGDAVRAASVVTVEGGGAWLVPSPMAALVILHEDDGVLVVDKPAGLAAHPLVPGEGGTIVDALAARYPEIADASPDAREGGLVHRLDTGTSGCLAVARDRATWSALRLAFSTGDDVFKRYLAIVEGHVASPLVVDGALTHDSHDRRRMRAAAPDEAGQHARTTALPIASSSSSFSLVEVEALGGRRHQVRAHLAAAGHPLVGDTLYGAAAADDAAWHLLHANALGLPGRPVIRAPVPLGFRQAASTRGLVVPVGGI